MSTHGDPLAYDPLAYDRLVPEEQRALREAIGRYDQACDAPTGATEEERRAERGAAAKAKREAFEVRDDAYRRALAALKERR